MKINPKQMEKMARKMGMNMTDIQAEEVIIRTQDKDIVIKSPSVSRVNMMGQESFQISGETIERPRNAFTDEDVSMVVEQTGGTPEEAEAALRETSGDLAESILRIKKNKSD